MKNLNRKMNVIRNVWIMATAWVLLQGVAFANSVNNVNELEISSNAYTTVEKSGTFHVYINGEEGITFDLYDAPTGVSFEGKEPGLLIISEETAPGIHRFTIMAYKDEVLVAEQEFILTVTAPPGISGPKEITLSEGYEENYIGVFTVTGYPFPEIEQDNNYSNDITWYYDEKAEKGTFKIASNLEPDRYPVKLTASRGKAYGYDDAIVDFTLIVTAPPVITSKNNLTVARGTKETFQVKTTGYPPVFSYDLDKNKPAGVSIDSNTGIITIDDDTKPGEHVFTIMANNGLEPGPNSNQEFTLTVTAPHGIEGPDKMKISKGYEETISIEDFKVTGFPLPEVTQDPNHNYGGKITWNYNRETGIGTLVIAPGLEGGEYPVELTASREGEKDVKASFKLTVTAPPGILGPRTMELNEGYTATSTEGFTITGFPLPEITKDIDSESQITWNNATNKLDIAAGLKSGSYPVILSVSNDIGKTTANFTLTVTAAPAAPKIISANNTTVKNGTAGEFQVLATGNPAVTFSLLDAPTGVNIDETTGLITIVQTLAVETYNFKIIASNGVNPEATQDFTLTVALSDAAAVDADKAALKWDNIKGSNTAANDITSDLTKPLPAKGDNGSTITWKSSNTAVISHDGDVTRPAYGSGDATVTLTATISKNGKSETVVFTLTVKKAVPPTITSANHTSVVSGTGGVFQVTATGDEPITFSLTGTMPEGVSINNETGLIAIASTTVVGNYTFTVVASNGSEPDDSQEFTLSVSTDPADRPGIVGPKTHKLTVGYKSTLICGYIIIGTATVTVEKTSGNDLITWESERNLFRIAAGLPEGVYPVIISASNEAGTVDFKFTLTVSAPVYDVKIPDTFTGGAVESDATDSVSPGETVTLTIMPEKGYELEKITVHKHDNKHEVVATSGTGNRRSFTMPSYPITVDAVFRRSGSTSIAETDNYPSLKAYAHDGVLYFSGAAEGATVRVYNMHGVLIASPNPSEGGAFLSPFGGVGGGLPLPGRGIYIVTDGITTVKVINN